MTDWDSQPPVREIECWRSNGWVFVALDGEVVWKRFTRDPEFTSAWVIFYSNRSPSVPKSRMAFQTVELRGQWRVAQRMRFYNNQVEVPISDERTVLWRNGLPVHQAAERLVF